MKAVKFCKKKYNIKTSNTLRLGTFEYYSKMDPSFSIADANEGWMQISGFNHADKYHGSAILDLHSSQGFVDQLQLNVRVAESGDAISNVLPRVKFRNCYIFCMSLLDDAEPLNPEEIDSDYDDFYCIDEEKLAEFAAYLCQLLEQQLKITDLNLDLIGSPSLQDISKSPVYITYFFQPVTYGDIASVEIQELIDTKNSSNFFENLIKGVSFVKSNKYIGNKEVRFLFLIHSESLGVIPVHMLPKDIELKPILKLLN